MDEDKSTQNADGSESYKIDVKKSDGVNDGPATDNTPVDSQPSLENETSEGADATAPELGTDLSNENEIPDSAEEESIGDSSVISPGSSPVDSSPAVVGSSSAAEPSEPVDQAASGVHPVTGAPLVSDTAKKSGRGKLAAIVVAAVIVLVLAAAYVFLIFLPNRPGAVYSSSLSRSGKAMDAWIDYSENHQPTDYQSYQVTGNAKINGKNLQFDGDFSGKYDKSGNTSTNVNVDNKSEGNQNSHVKFSLDLRTLKAATDDYPDIYFRLTGLSTLLDSLGGGQLSSLDGKWIVVKHDVLQQYASEFAGQADSTDQIAEPTKAEVFDALKKVQAVNEQYLFTSDPNTAILVKKQYVGAEVMYGRDTYHYVVGFDKAHLLAYTDAVAKALNSSELNNWSQKTRKSDLVTNDTLKSTKANISKDFDANYSFDLWADRDTRLIEAVRFTDKDNKKNSVTIAQNYNGGHTYPFLLQIEGDDSGDSGSLTMNLVFDGDSGEAKLGFNFTDNDNGNKTTANGNFDIKPSDQKVKVDAPTGATPLMDVLSGLGLGGDTATPSSPSSLGGSLSTDDNTNKAEAQSTLSESKSGLAMYYVDEGTYPKDKASFSAWLSGTDGGNNEVLAAELANGFTYTATPAGCNETSVKCDGFSLSASKSIWDGDADITVTN